ncbi:MAG: hypothetical protein BAW33_03085 [Desulfobacterales bacterium C00003104]|nr:MAG: hypothetical protein BAW33_03085 [Desulfobacterales bacterium C00003104]
MVLISLSNVVRRSDCSGEKLFFIFFFSIKRGRRLNTSSSFLFITNIDLHINNCTALSVKILDNVPQCTPYSNFSL